MIEECNGEERSSLPLRQALEPRLSHGSQVRENLRKCRMDLHGTDDAHVAYMPVYTIRKRIFHK